MIAKRDVEAARELETDDDAMDRIHRGLFRELLSDDWPYGVETAIDITLLGRYYERFADHAVSVARRVVYLVTGERQVAASCTAQQVGQAGDGRGLADRGVGPVMVVLVSQRQGRCGGRTRR